MTAWLRIEKEHEGRTAGAVISEHGTSFVPNNQRLVVIYGDDCEAVACEPDDIIKASDVALGVIDLPEFLRKPN
jgi:hypothetical protein